MRRLFLENWSMKLLSLLLASILWLFVLSERTIEYGLVVPVRLEGLPPDFVLTSHPVDSVNLRVSGPRPLLNTLNPDRIAVVLDLASVRLGGNSFQVADRLELPRGLKVTQVSPTEVSLAVDARARRMARVKVVVKGEPPARYQLADGAPSADPPLVEVVAARADIDELKTVQTLPVDLGTLEGDFEKKVPLDRADPRIQATSPSEVTVRIPVREKAVVEEAGKDAPVVPAPGAGGPGG